jgi:hypothetical protein
LPKQEQLPHSELGWDVRIPAKIGDHSCRLKNTSSLGLFCLVDDCFGDAIDGFAGLVVRFGGFDLLRKLSKTVFNLQQFPGLAELFDTGQDLNPCFLQDLPGVLFIIDEPANVIEQAFFPGSD